MAIEDYYRELFYIEKMRQPDETGGFEYVYIIGASFSGSAVKSGSDEQIIAGIRNNIAEQYNVTTYKNNVLMPNDIIMFVNDDGQRVFLRINQNALYTPEQSKQSEWKGVTASVFEPDLRVVN